MEQTNEPTPKGTFPSARVFEIEIRKSGLLTSQPSHPTFCLVLSCSHSRLPSRSPVRFALSFTWFLITAQRESWAWNLVSSPNWGCASILNGHRGTQIPSYPAGSSLRGD